MKTTYIYDKEQSKIVNKPVPMPRILDIGEYERWKNLGLVRFMDEIEVKIYNSLGLKGIQDYYGTIKETNHAN